MQDVMRNWTLREKYFENTLLFFIILGIFGEISRESVKSKYAINSLKVDVLLSKSNARF